MKFTVSIALSLAALAQAAEMNPQLAQAAQDAGKMAEVENGPIPESLKVLAHHVARAGGCFIQRIWIDAQHIDCGKCGKGGYNHKNNLVSCVCNNQKRIESHIRRDFNVCIDPKAPFSNVIKEVGADIGGLGLSALCGAYHGGQYHGGKHYGGKHYGGKHYGGKPHGEEYHGKELHVEEYHGKEPHVEEYHGKEPYVKEPYGKEPHGEEYHGKGPYGKEPHGEEYHPKEY